MEILVEKIDFFLLFYSEGTIREVAQVLAQIIIIEFVCISGTSSSLTTNVSNDR